MASRRYVEIPIIESEKELNELALRYDWEVFSWRLSMPQWESFEIYSIWDVYDDLNMLNKKFTIAVKGYIGTGEDHNWPIVEKHNRKLTIYTEDPE